MMIKTYSDIIFLFLILMCVIRALLINSRLCRNTGESDWTSDIDLEPNNVTNGGVLTLFYECNIVTCKILEFYMSVHVSHKLSVEERDSLTMLALSLD